MSIFIKDGTGAGYSAKVDSDNRVHTSSVTETTQASATKRGDSYQIGSSVVVLTSSAESAVLYVKNNEDRDLILTGINISSGAMTGSSASVFLAKAYLYGTGLSAGTSMTALNLNLGSSKSLSATITAGQQGATVTNGTAAGAFYIPANTFFQTDINWVMPKGSTLALSVTPGTSTSVFPVSVVVEAHLELEE